MPVLGPKDVIIALIVVLLIFGPRRLPALGRSLGSGMREFKNGILGKHETFEENRALPPAD
jgi:sec-independent protein translocase protein TatA